MEENGVSLPYEEREKVKVLRKEITNLRRKAQYNLKHDQTKVKLSEQELEGLPEAFINKL